MSSRGGGLGDPEADFSDGDEGCLIPTGKEGKEQPIFLRKTYQMLETCPSNIACWAENGESFLIKDPDAFAQKVIPQFFAHSNFSSFVRQLNFYGFRKVKNDVKGQPQSSKWWEFKHQKFVRGKQHLLSQIRRATHGANNEQEVNYLKTELCQLKGQMEEMSTNIEKLTSLVNELMVDKMRRERHEPQKKRKSDSPYRRHEEMEMDLMGDAADFVKSEFEPSSAEMSRMSAHLAGAADPFYEPAVPIPSGMSQDRSFDPVSDDEFAAYLDGLGISSERVNSPMPRSSSPWALDNNCHVATQPPSNSSMVVVDEQQEQHDDEMSALQQSLSNLSPELQQKLVETLVSKLGTEVQQQDAQEVSVPKEEAVVLPVKGGAAATSSAPAHSAPIALPLASAVLGAFLSQYAHSQMAQDSMAKPPAGRKGIRSQG